jgi:uncharacterized protein
MKLVFWLILAIAVVFVLRNKKKAAQKSATRSAPSNDSARAGESMLRCTHCGVYVPESEALRNAVGAAFCSHEHRQQGSAG